jgi:FixJ family two-component response regulator
MLACSICTDVEHCQAIDRSLASGASNREVAHTYALSEAGVRRHRTRHWSKHFKAAKATAEEQDALDVRKQR